MTEHLITDGVLWRYTPFQIIMRITLSSIFLNVENKFYTKMELKHVIEAICLFMMTYRGMSQVQFQKCVPDFSWGICKTCNIFCIEPDIWMHDSNGIELTECSMGKLEKGKLDRFNKSFAFNFQSVGIQSIEINAFQSLNVLENLLKPR